MKTGKTELFMTYSIRMLVFLAVFTMSPWAGASERAELDLWKHDPFMYGMCGHCGDFITFHENKNRAEFTEFSLYDQTGYYSVVLKGPAGTVVTLYGAMNFKKEKGYLILVKKDDALVQIEDLEAFPQDRWVDFSSGKEGKGGYSAFFKPYPNFKNNIASIQWEKK
ncbi:MAG: hypothetical protein ACE5E9_01565 [Nitrospinaceae bacterium]